MMMKKAGNSAVIVRIPESSSPYKCMKIAAIIMNFGIAIIVSIHNVTTFSVAVSYTHLTLPTNDRV